jgi:hypothetical protein
LLGLPARETIMAILRVLRYFVLLTVLAARERLAGRARAR